jgi:hypothetical protein
LIDKLEEDDIPGVLLLIDFEKAFDTVEWSFIEKTLQFYGFGPSLQKWIKAFYCDISSAVTNNGHVSEIMIDQAISGYHLISMRSHQHIDLKNIQNHLFLPLLFLGHFLIAALKSSKTRLNK